MLTLWDTFCRAEAKTVPARGKALINTELSIAVPEGTYGRIAPRSGLGELLRCLADDPSRGEYGQLTILFDAS